LTIQELILKSITVNHQTKYHRLSDEVVAISGLLSSRFIVKTSSKNFLLFQKFLL